MPLFGKSKKEEEKSKQDSKTFDDFLNRNLKPKICDSCPSVKKDGRGAYQNPCEKGYEDSGLSKALCEEHPNKEYRPKK